MANLEGDMDGASTAVSAGVTYVTAFYRWHNKAVSSKYITPRKLTVRDRKSWGNITVFSKSVVRWLDQH